MAKFKHDQKFCYLYLPVLKVLKHIFNIIVWTVLGLYLTFILTFSIPAVQEYMAQRAAHALARKLGTSVSIARLNYDIPSHLTLRHVIIRDKKGRDMLSVNRLSARVDLLPLTDGKISISSAQLFGATARLYQPTADSQPNFQFVLDSLASKDTTSTTPLDLRINSLIVRNVKASYHQLDAPYTPGTLNPKHLDVQNLNGHIILKVLNEDSINVNVKRLSLSELSGLRVDRLSMRFTGGRKGCRLEDFLLRMPNTLVQLGDLEAHYRFRGDHFVMPSLAYSGSIKPSTVTLADLSCLLPSLKTFHSTLSVESHFSGTDEVIKVPHLTVSSTTGDIGTNISGEIRELRKANPHWTVNIEDLALSGKTVSFISENMKGKRIEVPQEIVRLGSIHMKGTASGRGTDEISTHGTLNTDAGNIALGFALDEHRNFTGNIDTKHFELGQILDDKNLGPLTTMIELSGHLPANSGATVKAQGYIQQLVYNGYNYQDIEINGQLSPADIQGRLNIDDANLKLTAEGMITTNKRHRNVKLAATVSNFSPKTCNLSSLWGDARFSGNVNADFTASNLGDAVGSISLDAFNMKSDTDEYALKQLRIESGYDNSTHYVNLKSDFGEASIAGDFNEQTLPQSIINFIADKLPTLPGLPHANPHTHNNITLHATINNTDWMQKLLHIPLTLAEPMTLDGLVNDQNRLLRIHCELPAFAYNGSRYSNGHVSIQSPQDKLEYDLAITKLMDDGDLVNLRAYGDAGDNKLLTTLSWTNSNTPLMNGTLTGSTTFSTLPDGQQVTHLDIAPSKMLLRNAEWDLLPCNVTYYNKHLDISGFTIRHDQQYLTLNGTASENTQDSIVVSMRDIDIDYVLNLVNFHAVDFSGQATGGGSIRGIFGDMEAEGQLKVNDFQFQHGRMGTLDANVSWNKDDKQIDIHATADDGPEAMTLIDGYVSPERNFIDLGIEAKGTSLEFAQSFTESFIGSLAGNARGRLRLIGPLDAINLTGGLMLNGRAFISTLNCTYEMRNDSLLFEPNEITFVHCPIYDRLGHQGILTGGIHHQELTNLTFDIFVDAKNLLAYDFQSFGNSTFYGTVFADGHVAIHGRDASVVIEAEATPLPGSVFVYNAASPGAINDQEFIHWGVAKPKSSEYSESTETSESPKHPVPTPSTEYRSDLQMNLKINVTPNATIRLLMDERTNDYITLRGTGELQTNFYNKGGFNMFGTYRVTDGTYGLTIQNIIRKNFVFKEGGTIVFSGDPYDAALNLQAQNTVNGVSLSDLNVGRSFSNTVRVNCLMNITGQPRQPRVDFDLEMPNVNADEQQMVRSIINSEEEMNQQVVYLLAVGRFYPQGANNATETAANSQSKTSLAMQSLLSGTLSGQINNVLGQVIKSNNWNFGANISTGDEGWNNAEYEGLISGRLLNNRLLINGQFGYRDKATTATPSFIGDFDIRYLLFPNGNLALKVYNQSNDRYFTKSSLNTQGIGIIMKKDFNGLGDLLGTKRKKKKEKK